MLKELLVLVRSNEAEQVVEGIAIMLSRLVSLNVSGLCVPEAMIHTCGSGSKKSGAAIGVLCACEAGHHGSAACSA
jgi:hypothetical protein